mgnify:CR=1 FL=1
MSKPKKGFLPKMEMLIIIVFAVCFLIWALPKCASIMSSPDQDSTVADTEDTTATREFAQNLQTDQDTTALAAPTVLEKVVTKEVSALYITIDNLKMRRTPDLKADVIKQLPLFERVYFMEEVTDSLYEINLGYEVAKEPWVKIRTQKGMEGWVYGAGVNYYKKKRSGVLE